MNQSSRILVAGHNGLVGTALVRTLKNHGYSNLILRDRKQCDLEDATQVKKLFDTEKPDVVIAAAAKVGGILANNTYPYDFIEKNLKIELNLINESHRHDVAEFVLLGSSCIYPKLAPIPIKEEALLTGPLEPTNRPYALAKIAGIELCWALNRQFGRRYFSVMPTNLYGIEDNFDLQTSHVIPAILMKFHRAKIENKPEVEIWGTGSPLREFLFNDDLAEGIVHLLKGDKDALKFMFSDSTAPLINIGSGSDIAIGDLAKLIQKIVGYKGSIVFDKTKPDGTPRKLMDSGKMFSLGWRPKVGLEEGLMRVYQNLAGAKS